ncbi:MAG: intradiol ring-cleavage dioxygenase [Candidatus Methylopumilus sp.]|jgi:protocatechuate 3,4-dioxygenase beta subunit
MQNDKRPPFTRRNMLQLLAAASASLLTGCGTDLLPNRGKTSSANLACIVTPEQTEGPYFVDEKLMRSDIRFDPADGSIQEGLPLTLAINVYSVGITNCQPLKDAIVDIWHCNAEGVYSDAKDRSFDTRGRKFLRGYKQTDDQGSVKFFTIYPGWYDGRTVHIHFKIRTTDTQGKTHEFSSQLYFDDALSDQVFATEPYARKGQRTTLNRNDGIYEEGGPQLTLKPTKTADGYNASFDVGLNFA